jgi:hypothetical protein
MWKEAIVAYIEVRSWDFLMNLEKKNHEELRVGQSLSVAEVDT